MLFYLHTFGFIRTDDVCVSKIYRTVIQIFTVEEWTLKAFCSADGIIINASGVSYSFIGL